MSDVKLRAAVSTSIASMLLAALLSSCADSSVKRADASPISSASPSSVASPSLAALVAALPDANEFSTATQFGTPPPQVTTSGSGKWVVMTSLATDPVARFVDRWEAEVVLAAFWRLSGESNSAVSGGDLTFAQPSANGQDDGIQYSFADNASNYLFTDANSNPSSLTVPDSVLKQQVTASVAAMGATVKSIDIFHELGSDVSVVATANSIDDVNLAVNPFGDSGRLEGTCLVIESQDGSVLAQWSYSTGLQAGHGGSINNPGSLSRPLPSAK